MRLRESIATNDIPAPASPATASATTTTSRYTIGVVVGLLLVLVLWPLFKGATDASADGKASVAPACARWDELASGTVARLLQEGKRDADLQQVSDAVFRIRRARRNCRVGWVTLACQDYAAIVRNGRGFTATRPPLSSVCALTATGEAGTAAR